ncbi:MAG: HEAT repeat domain-containing protein [Candidatus Firestonebacteria bacterium]|nr:HEAT repeat domain-containing protein [Candidatus Firestonebacteria bacterium]
MNIKTIIIFLIFIAGAFEFSKISAAEEEPLGMENISVFSDEDFAEEKHDTAKVLTQEIDYSMMDETYIVARQTKDIDEVREKKIQFWISQLDLKSDPVKRKDSVVALGKIKEPRAVSGLVNVVRNKEEIEDIRFAAAWSLGNMGLEIIPELDKLAHDPDRKVKIYAIWAMGVNRSKSIIPVLKKIDEETSPEDKILKKAILNTKKLFDTSLLRSENW